MSTLCVHCTAGPVGLVARSDGSWAHRRKLQTRRPGVALESTALFLSVSDRHHRRRASESSRAYPLLPSSAGPARKRALLHTTTHVGSVMGKCPLRVYVRARPTADVSSGIRYEDTRNPADTERTGECALPGTSTAKLERLRRHLYVDGMQSP